MTHKIQFNVDDRIIFLTMNGSLDLKSMKAAVTEVVSTVKQENCYYILTDLRDTKPTVSIGEMFDFLASLPVTSNSNGVNLYLVRRAFVVKQELDAFMFYETASRNRGLITKLFLDFNEARSWLRSIQSP